MSAKPKTEPAPPRAVRNVKTVPIDAIHIDPGNVRVHPERNKATIRASLARFGAGRSIVLDGNNIVRAGNGTVEQARDAGYTEVLVVEPGPNQIVAVKRPDWSDSVGTAYSIADNTSTDQSEDDPARLAATLEALRNDGFDLAAMGHSSEGLDELLKSLADEALADADAPEPAEDPGPQIDRADELQEKWGTALGQLWIIPSKSTNGEHRILCGDSTKAEDIARVCEHPVETIVSDPPWGIDADTDYTRFVNGISPNRNHGNGILGDASPFDPSPWLAYPRVAFWGANCFHDRLPMGKWLVWLKKRESQIGTFMSDAELCWVKSERTPRRAPGVYAFEHVWHGFDRESERGKVNHPMQKPVALMNWTIEMAEATPGETVLDPYLGSGPTIVAAEQTGRLARGIEIAPKYVAVALERLEGLGLCPVLA